MSGFINITKYTKLTSVVSLLLVVFSIGITFTKKLNLSIDFVGGIVAEFSQENGPEIKTKEVRELLSEVGFKDYFVQTVNATSTQNTPSIMIRVGVKNKDDYAKVLKKIRLSVTQKFSTTEISFYKMDYISPQVGSTQSTNALLALLASFLVTTIYLAFRFSLIYSLGVIFAIIHDVIIVVGFVSFTQIPIDLSAIAAILTVMGYSVNDSVIIYDRIRELKGLEPKSTSMRNVINKGISLTLSRTVITSSTTALTLIAIIALGSSTIQNFATIVLFGIVIGTLSSITVSSNALIWLKEKR